MLNENQLDALKELCNIGSGSAATVLSGFLKRDLRIEVPRILAGPEAVAKLAPSAEWLYISHLIGGPIGGRLVVCVRQSDAERMVKVLLGSVAADWRQDDNSMSAVREVSNILTSYFLSVLGQFFKQVLVPGVPVVLSADSESLQAALSEAEESILVETSFKEKGGEAVWYLLVQPEPDAITAALDGLLKRTA
jgi:chemotaxis protein CheC